MFKRQKGITLIALVITIVVMLILAGVTLSTVVGNNGILNRAKVALKKTKASTVQEAVEMATASAQIQFLTEKNEKTFYEFLTYDLFERELENVGYKMIGDKDDISKPYNSNIADSSIESVVGEDGNIVYMTDTKEKGEVYAVELLADSNNSSNVLVGETVIANTTFGSSITVDNYGQKVNYSAQGIDDWKIFYTDKIHTYIISSYYVDVTDLNNDDFPIRSYGYGVVANRIGNYSSQTYGGQFADALTDKEAWNDFVDDKVANFAFATPTLKIFLNSYNQKYNMNMKIIGNKTTGYYINWNDNASRKFNTEDSLYVMTDTPNVWGVWLATEYNKPDYRAYCCTIWSNGTMSPQQYWKNCAGIRPIVCLKTDCIGTESTDEDGNIVWNLE